MVCVYDANNTPRKALPTVDAPPLQNGDCPKGYISSVTNAKGCDKQCNTDAECGGNKCKAVGPIGVGKQCQKN
jgi:hypothetical protein